MLGGLVRRYAHYIGGFIAGFAGSWLLTFSFLVYEIMEWIQYRDTVSKDIREFLCGLYAGFLLRLLLL